MSPKKKAKKRASQLNGNDTERNSKKNAEENGTELHSKDVPNTARSKQPIIDPDGKIFYPCQYCSRLFPQKNTSITHMKKCPSRDYNLLVESNTRIRNESNINNNKEHLVLVEENGNLKCSSNSTENKAPQKEIRINLTQNIIAQKTCSEKQIMNDTSIYDFNEEDSIYDSDTSLDKELMEKKEDPNNKLCKHCNTLFDSPLELLRHIRDTHNFPKTILPPHEIEKYFDSPKRDFCPICQKPIKTRNYRSVFIKHLLIHTNGLTYECSVCKKKFKRRDHMRTHKKRHIVKT